MDNPLQEIAGGFTFAGMKRLIAFLLALLPVTMLSPLASEANTSCSNGFCTQTFYYTGSSQEFLVPEGVTTIRFEVNGASGSRGGAGGQVTGSLSNLPERLIIEVGQSGIYGSNRPGGYNGGGASGGSKGNEGSGGGASDIRLATDLQSRIVVAGGGGGGGGGAGAAGAPGGGLIAESGTPGQATQGFGGTQTEDGLPGANNGSGQQPTAGGFGIGGAGGSGTVAGGGGGGGGWFGGGGGGGDDAVGGGDGAGAGGGSSYTAAEYASDVVHQAGVQWGHGRIYIYYQLPTQVLSFTGEQLQFGQIKYQLIFDQSAQDLNADDFTYSRADCSIWRIGLNDNVAEVTLSGCGGDEVTLTLKSNSVGLETFGPPTSVSATVFIDRVGPSLSWESELVQTSRSEVSVTYSTSDALTPELADFDISGCDLSLEANRVLLSSCSEGVHSIRFKALSLMDNWGNPGPTQDSVLLVTVDKTAPVATWSEPVVTGTGPFTYSAQLSFSEAVHWSQSAVSFSSEMGCETGHEGERFWAVCDYGAVSWSLDSSLIQDNLGNAGIGAVTAALPNPRPALQQPTQSESVAAVVAPPAPAPEPAPQTPVAPVQPEAPSEPAPTQPAPSGPAIVITPTPEPVPTEVPLPETSSPNVDQDGEPEPQLDYLIPSTDVPGGIAGASTLNQPSKPVVRELSEIPISASLTEPAEPKSWAAEAVEVTQQDSQEPLQQVVGPKIEFETKDEFPWLLSILVGVVTLLGLGIWRFSGR